MAFGVRLIDFDSNIDILIKELKPIEIEEGNSPGLINRGNINPPFAVVPNGNPHGMLIKLYDIVFRILLSRIITSHHLIKRTINESLLSIVELG